MNTRRVFCCRTAISVNCPAAPELCRRAIFRRTHKSRPGRSTAAALPLPLSTLPEGPSVNLGSNQPKVEYQDRQCAPNNRSSRYEPRTGRACRRVRSKLKRFPQNNPNSSPANGIIKVIDVQAKSSKGCDKTWGKPHGGLARNSPSVVTIMRVCSSCVHLRPARSRSISVEIGGAVLDSTEVYTPFGDTRVPGWAWKEVSFLSWSSPKV
jgi:hypothetical protein